MNLRSFFFLDKINYFKLHNLIETKKKDGALDLKSTKKMFKNWYIKEKIGQIK